VLLRLTGAARARGVGATATRALPDARAAHVFLRCTLQTACEEHHRESTPHGRSMEAQQGDYPQRQQWGAGSFGEAPSAGGHSQAGGASSAAASAAAAATAAAAQQQCTLVHVRCEARRRAAASLVRYVHARARRASQRVRTRHILRTSVMTPLLP
jgi:hypothetical protein